MGYQHEKGTGTRLKVSVSERISSTLKPSWQLASAALDVPRSALDRLKSSWPRPIKQDGSESNFLALMRLPACERFTASRQLFLNYIGYCLIPAHSWRTTLAAQANLQLAQLKMLIEAGCDYSLTADMVECAVEQTAEGGQTVRAKGQMPTFMWCMVSLEGLALDTYNALYFYLPHPQLKEMLDPDWYSYGEPGEILEEANRTAKRLHAGEGQADL